MELEQLNPRQFERFRDLIYRASGIRVGDNKRSLLTNRIRRRLRAGPFDDFDAYYTFLTSPRGRDEVSHFLDAITTNETSFFRTPTHFDWFESEFLTEAVAAQRRGQRAASLRIWSAGCATGAEPYTIAICLLQNLFRLRDWTLSILGTDISDQALRDARAGCFRPRAIEAVTEKQRRRYFAPVGPDGQWHVRPAVQKLISFEPHNLMQPMSAPPFDCVFIRNVLIYFDGESKAVVVKNLIRALAPGGYLVVGPSEGIYNMLEPLKRRSPFLYQKPVQATTS